MERIAVLIGNGRFPDEPGLPDLQGPANDVDRMEKVLAAQDIGAFSQVIRFVDEKHYAITPLIDQILTGATPDTFVLIYYSGHGKLSTRGQLCLTTADTRIAQLQSTSLPLPVIKGFIDESPCRQVLLILDCCFSGAAGKAFLRGTLDEQMVISTTDASGLHILSSSTAVEVSRETDADESGAFMGAFTRCLVEGLQSGDADVNGDGRITVEEIREYMRHHLSGQRPRYWGIDAGAEPVLAWNPAPARREEQRREAERLRLVAAQQRATDWFRAGKLPASVYTRLLTCLESSDNSTLGPLERHQLIDLLEDDHTTPSVLVTAWGFMNSAGPSRTDAVPEQPQQENLQEKPLPRKDIAESGAPQVMPGAGSSTRHERATDMSMQGNSIVDQRPSPAGKWTDDEQAEPSEVDLDSTSGGKIVGAGREDGTRTHAPVRVRHVSATGKRPLEFGRNTPLAIPTSAKTILLLAIGVLIVFGLVTTRNAARDGDLVDYPEVPSTADSTSTIEGTQAATLIETNPDTYDLSAVEVPPNLINRDEVARALSRNYPPLLRDAGVTGQVLLRIRILSDGTVDPQSVSVEMSTHDAFTDAAKRVVLLMRFSSAKVAGTPVRVWVSLPVTFQLQR
jgi:TonB family protein